MKEHFDDEFVKRAQREGYRSRAVFKLEEIQRKDHILKPGMSVVDLGAAPGGWSQYALGLVGRKGRVVAMDILPMEPLPGVAFVQGDFREETVLEVLLNRLNGREIDLVMSDIAPNITGVDAVDQPRAMYLAELAVDFADRVQHGLGDIVDIMLGAGLGTLDDDGPPLSGREISSWDFSRSIEFFLIVDSEREEVDAEFRLSRSDRCG